MKTSSLRSRRHRNPQQNADVQNQTSEQAAPFFSNGQVQTKKETAFFQPKLTIGKADDPYEREADAVADKVVNKTNGQPPSVQNKEISAVQRLATPDEDKMPATNDGRMAEDKKIQEKPMVQKMEAPKEEEKPDVQKMEAPKEEEKPAVQKMEAPKEEEKPAVQKMEAPKEEEKPAVQKMEAPKEEEKPAVQKMEAPKEEEKLAVQKMEAPKEEEKPAVQKMEAPKEEEQPAVQAKAEGGGGVASQAVTSKIDSTKGRGERMPENTKHKMESAFGRDFSDVHIHNDTSSVELNQELHAQAFTHGKDIYFNSGKFNPENTEGSRLLAHELTHVVQQKGDLIQRKPDLYRGGNASSPRIDNVRDTDIPVDKDGYVSPKTGGISTFDKPLAGKNWWRFAKDFDAPAGIFIYNDHGNHYLWEPATRMLRTEFVQKLQASIPQWVKHS